MCWRQYILLAPTKYIGCVGDINEILLPGALGLGKAQGGQPRSVPLAVLGPDIACSAGVRVAVYDSQRKRNITTIFHRDAIIDDRPAWMLKAVGPLLDISKPVFQPSIILPPPDLDFSAQDGSDDTESEIVQCGLRSRQHRVTESQKGFFGNLFREQGIAFECTMLGRHHHISDSLR